MKRDKDQILIEWLVLCAQLGDTEALSQLMRLIYPKLLRFAGRQLQDDEAAKDVVQNTLEIVIRDIARIKDPAAFPQWVYQILHRKSVDHIRRNQRQRKMVQDVDPEMCQVLGEEENSHFIQFEEFISRLDADAYQVIHLHYLEGLNLNEIAAVLNVPQGTVKSRLFNARNRLKQFLEGEHHE